MLLEQRRRRCNCRRQSGEGWLRKPNAFSGETSGLFSEGNGLASLRVCLVGRVISELLSLLIQADFNMYELRYWHVFGSPCLLRNAEFIRCLVGCMRWEGLNFAQIPLNTQIKSNQNPIYTNKKQLDLCIHKLNAIRSPYINKMQSSPRSTQTQPSVSSGHRRRALATCEPWPPPQSDGAVIIVWKLLL
jgi:hypothetical protein